MSFELDEQNLPRLSDADREALNNDYSAMPAAMDDDAIARRDRAQALSYALSKQVPEIRAGGAVFSTAYGDLTLDSEGSRRVADLVESLLRARLASDAGIPRDAADQPKLLSKRLSDQGGSLSTVMSIISVCRDALQAAEQDMCEPAIVLRLAYDRVGEVISDLYIIERKLAALEEAAGVANV